MSAEEDLLASERRLQAAQLAGDVGALDALLDDRLVGIGPDGSVVSKEEDLEIHRSGALRITKFVEESVDVLVDGSLGLSFAVMDAEADQGGVAFKDRLRYTRTWVLRDEGWRVIAAHISVVP